MKSNQVYNTIQGPWPSGLQTALASEMKQQQHLLTARARRIPARLRSPAAGATREPRMHGGRRPAGQPPHPPRTHRLSQPSFCPRCTFFLLLLLLPSQPRQSRSSHLSHLIPPGAATAAAAAAEGAQCARAAPPAPPQAPGPPLTRRHGRGGAGGSAASRLLRCLGHARSWPWNPSSRGGSWTCFPTGRKARSPSISDADDALPRAGKGQQDPGVVAHLVWEQSVGTITVGGGILSEVMDSQRE